MILGLGRTEPTDQLCSSMPSRTGSSDKVAPGTMKSLWLMSCMLLSAAVASAHVNDRGMDYRHYKDRYGQSCCDERDCRPAADFVETVVSGQAVVGSGGPS